MTALHYRACNRPLDLETDERCEFDGYVAIALDQSWRCPACHAKRWLQ